MSTRDLIIRKSIRLFLRTSFKATSIQDIVDTLGITKGAFYWHFKSKDDLLLTIIEKYDSEFLCRLYAHMEACEGTFFRKFEEYSRYINEYARDHSEICALFVTLAAEMVGSRTEAERRIKRAYREYHAFIGSLLALGKEEGLLEAGYDVAVSAHLVLAIHHGLLLQRYMNRTTVDMPLLAGNYQDMILFGMVKKNR